MRHSGAIQIAVTLACVWPGVALAHPHVFIEPRMEVTATADGHLQALRNIWRFDELFSSSVVVDFDRNGDGGLDRAELAAVGEQVSGSIRRWSYYTFVRSGGAAVEMQAPSSLGVSFDAKHSQLVFDFAMRPKAPLDLRNGDVSFSNFDDTYFVAFDFKGAKDFTVRDMPKGCAARMTAPSPDDAAKSWMATIAAIPADADVPADGIRFSQVLSTKFSIACGKG